MKNCLCGPMPLMGLMPPDRPDRLTDRLPVRERTTFLPRPPSEIALPLEKGPPFDQEQSRTANKGSKSRQGPPTDAPRALQDRPQTPQEQSRTAHRRPKSSPGPPTKVPGIAQDHPQKLQERPWTVHKRPRSNPGLPTEGLTTSHPSIEALTTPHPSIIQQIG